jgi:hypothetical protein
VEQNLDDLPEGAWPAPACMDAFDAADFNDLTQETALSVEIDEAMARASSARMCFAQQQHDYDVARGKQLQFLAQNTERKLRRDHTTREATLMLQLQRHLMLADTTSWSSSAATATRARS